MGQFNQDELIPPRFLTEKFILDMLRSSEKDPQLHVINYDIQPGSAAGDHYASLMFKIIVSYGSGGEVVQDRRLILKTAPEEQGQKKDLLDDIPVFKSETLMYTKILPAMEEFLKQNGELPYWPKLVYFNEESQILVFDDLTVENYQVIHKNLNMKNTKLVLDKLAKYHAMSMILAERDDYNEMKDCKSHFESEVFRNMFRNMTRHVKSLAKAVKSWPNYENMGEKLEVIEGKLFDTFVGLLKKEPEGFRVLNHGDFHIRNLMFKENPEEAGSISKVIFLDFQMPIYHSPAIDIYYLLNTIGDDEVRDHRDYMVKLYHEILEGSLKQNGFSGTIPSAVDVHIELLRFSQMNAMHLLLALPIFQLDLTGMELGELFADNSSLDAKLEELFNKPSFAEKMKTTLKSLDNFGLLD